MTRLHYAIETDGILGCVEVQPVCGNNFHGRKKLTDDWEAVTCPECIRLCGFEAAPLDQTTLVESDPLRRAA